MWKQNLQWGGITRTCKWLLKHWNPLLTLLAVIISVLALTISARQNELTAQFEHLDFHPDVKVRAVFRSRSGDASFYRLWNDGPVAAVQVDVQLISHSYSPDRGRVDISRRFSENDVSFPVLKPQEAKDVQFDRAWLDSNARIQQPPQCNVMELRITYRRPQDLEEYSRRAFYFINPEGHWVPERSMALDTDFYREFKAALLRAVRRDVPDHVSIYDQGFPSDTLHQF